MTWHRHDGHGGFEWGGVGPRLSSLALLAVTSIAGAQAPVVSGTVFDSVAGRPLAGATIQLTGAAGAVMGRTASASTVMGRAVTRCATSCRAGTWPVSSTTSSTR